jgi:uncharacterized protein YlxP (DUF503 family)
VFVGLCLIEIHIPLSRSLKEKRSVMNSLKGRIESRFNAAVAEVDHQDLWQRAALGIAVVGIEPSGVEAVLDRVREVVEREDRAQVLTSHVAVQRFEP